MAHVGVMGGTFDPIHLGHLVCAEMARDACGLDEVLFVVAGNPHFKQGISLAPAKDRLAMVQRAIEGNDAFAVSDREVIRAGITYTVDTLEELHEEQPDAELSFILGADSLLTLSTWKDAARIAQLARIVCLARPGYRIDEDLLTSLSDQGFLVEAVRAPLLDISSSDIRARVRSGKTIRYLVPDGVAGHIRAQGLYR
jgi:nicotinate-nucleotide adenylyltransferase